MKRWMSQILGTLQTEKRPPSTSELRNRSGRAVREDEHAVTRAEFHGTLKMRFVHFPVRFRTLGFKNSGRTTPPSVHIRMLREFLSCCGAESSGSRHNDQICATLVNSHLRNLITICRSGGFSEKDQQVAMKHDEPTFLLCSPFVRNSSRFTTISVTFTDYALAIGTVVLALGVPD